ncbi:hypothetical protein HCN44_008826 [Aphidius gifuensis]|uniref:YqaJ viral recombinase domain-containing protein n=1 Tax=Aphidius gifuensis TaxID=684658 RepID=A0A835CXP6_APHGI|nr:hypothetical protein HCN44_008826 [Aphidius gifuensis]
MLLSINDITEWLGCNFERRNYVYGEKILNAKHLTRCGLNATKQNANDITFWAQCISTSKPKEKPHDINGVIKKNGKIISVKCSCVAGFGEKSDNLSILSCTDKKCSWKTQEYNNAIENLKPVPMTAHVCPARSLNKRKSLSDETSINDNSNSITRNKRKNKDNNMKVNELTDQQLEKLNMKLLIDLPKSSLVKDKFGRHDAVQHVEKSIDLTQSVEDLIMRIFSTQTSDLMEYIKNINLSVEPDLCCIKILQELSKDLPELCCQTKLSYSSWREARRCRITGSICQKVLGHSKSHNQQWSQKFVEFFYPKSFSSKYTKHGIDTEPEARAEFVKQT